MNHREMKVNRVATLLGAVFLMLGFYTGLSGQRIEIPDAVYYNGKVSAQIQPYSGAANMVRTLGKERAERAVPMREFMDHGLIVSGGSDWGGNSTSNNPFVRNSDLGPVGLAEKISRAETINNTYMTFEEKIKGSIEAGKLADFVILSHDIMAVPEEQIRDITPLATFVGGKKAYSAPGGGF